MGDPEGGMTIKCIECGALANPSYGTFVVNIVGAIQFQCPCGYILTVCGVGQILTDDPIKRMMAKNPTDDEILDMVKLRYTGKHHANVAPQQG